MYLLANSSKTRIARLTMCGLVAIIAKNKSGFFYKDKTIFLQMLLSDMFRGLDSTGIFAVNKYGNVDTIKDKLVAPTFINQPAVGKFLDKMVNDYHIMVGHNRKATMGGITAETAHPFVEGNTVLVHNGTLINHKKFSDKTVDSHAICHNIDEKGYKDTLKTIDGAYALIWYSADKKTLYFTRNAERPLYLVETTDKIYLASESKMLDWILDRNDITKYTIQDVPTDKVFKFDLETRKLECESKPKKESLPSQTHCHNPSWKRKNYQTSDLGYGNLALVHSSVDTQTVVTEASIDTYKSGETISWKITDWDHSERSCKLTGATCDEFHTDVLMFLDNKLYNKKRVDDLIENEYVCGKISSISSKKGVLKIYMSSIYEEETYTMRGNKVIPKTKFEEVGGACFCCGQVLKDTKDLRATEITLNSKGEIQYVICGDCNDATTYSRYY